MNLLERFEQPCFVPLQPGIHEVLFIAWDIKLTQEGQQYVQVTFAPASQPSHIHITNVYAERTELFIGNMQNVMHMPGVSPRVLLDACKGRTFTSSFEINVTPEKTYYNWSIGWVRPASTNTDVDFDAVATTTATKAPRK